jgi:hypothetical protein
VCVKSAQAPEPGASEDQDHAEGDRAHGCVAIVDQGAVKRRGVLPAGPRGLLAGLAVERGRW